MKISTRICLTATLLPLLLTACKPKLPAGVLSESKMERVLHDYHLAQGMAETIPLEEGQSYDQMRYEYQQAVFRKHDITEAEFDSSLVFYCSDLRRMNRMYSRVADRLQREADALGIASGPRDIYADLSAEGDTANVWRDRPLFVVKSAPVDNLQTWELECDSTWLPCDNVLWRFSILKLSRSRTSDTFADLIVIYTNDSVRSQLLSIGGRDMCELQIDNPRDWTPRRICGHLYAPIEEKAENMRFFFALQPALIRFHQPASVRERWAKADSLSSDSLLTEGLMTDSLSLPKMQEPEEHRRTPEEFREEQVVDRTINVVKEKPYVPGSNKGRRRLQNKPSQRRARPRQQ